MLVLQAWTGDSAAWIANLVTTVALIVTLVQLALERRREREQRRFEAYNALNDQYVAVARLAAENPTIDCFDEPLVASLAPKDDAARRKESAAFLEVISLLERAYIFYHRVLTPRDPTFRTQWPGWEKYSASFMGRDRFLVTWDKFRSEFDSDFTGWLGNLRPRAPARPIDND